MLSEKRMDRDAISHNISFSTQFKTGGTGMHGGMADGMEHEPPNTFRIFSTVFFPTSYQLILFY